MSTGSFTALDDEDPAEEEVRESMLIGTRKQDLDTPVLWVDLDLMEGNIRRLSAFFREVGVGWRPHTKGIKVPAIAHRLIKAGAIGITCAKLSEAEVMAEAGIEDILVANQLVGRQKIARLVHLRRYCDVMTAVDSMENVQAISEAAVRVGVKIRVLIEVDAGMHRAGLEAGQAVLAFAKRIASHTAKGIELAGVMGWEGHTCDITDPEEKHRRVREAVEPIVESAALCRKAGFPMPIVSCGGSGTYSITARIPGVTEIEAGGAVFTDVTYRSWGVDLDPALFVLATVTSRPTATRAIVDAGRKAMDGQTSLPVPRDLRGVHVSSLHAEHGLLELAAETPLGVGDKLDFTVGYGDNTVYQHDTLYGVRDGIIEAVWPILGRGKLM